MDLRGRIQARRSEKRRKSPFRPTLYTRIAALVRRFSLDAAFLDALGSPRLSTADPAALELKRKEALEPHLFSLSTEAEHRVTLGILDRVKVPYLAYATSPDEILACGELFERNPSLSPEILARLHFETLLLEERFRAHPQPLGRSAAGDDDRACEEERP